MTVRLSKSHQNMALGLLAVAVCVAPLVAAATDYYFQSGATDFSDLDSYLVNGVKPAVLPDADDIVHLPKGAVTVTAPSQSFTALSAAGRLVPDSSTLTIDVPNAADVCNMGAAFAHGDETEHGYHLGCLVKSGAGTLNLTAGASPDLAAKCAYYSNIAVKEGVLKAPETSLSSYIYLGHVAVSNDATFVLASNAGMSAAGLFGGGLVTNAAATARTLQIQCSWGNSIRDGIDFSGSIGGPVLLTSNGVGSFSGTNSTFSGELTLYHRVETSAGGIPADKYVLGVAKFGVAGAPSSIGTNGTVYTGYYGGSFRYLGEGETTDKAFVVQQLMLGSTFAIPLEFDGGETGGLVFEGGKIASKYANAGSFIPRLHLTGSHANACVVASPISYGGTYPFHVKKTGSGRWEFLRGAKTDVNCGAFTIEEGEFGYDSLADRGKESAFGTSTNLYKFSASSPGASLRTPYAFAVGSDGKTATLDYMGTNRASAVGRVVGLAGTGRFTTSGEKRSEVYFDGVSAIGSGAERTLVLDGIAGTNTFANVTNGEGVVSVVKRGAGTWVMEKETSFSGSLSVEGGTLVVRAPDVPYSWHRFTIKSIWSSSGFPSLKEFAMYNTSGARCNKGLVCDHRSSADSGNTFGPTITPKNNAMELEPGHATFSDGRNHKVGYNSEDLPSVFDDSSSSKWFEYVLGDNGRTPTESTPARWIKITMRQKADAGEVVAYDMVETHSTASGKESYPIKTYMVEGSQDGASWTVLTNATYGIWNADTGTFDNPTSTLTVNKWYSNFEVFAANRELGENEGFRIPGRPAWNGPAALANAAKVKVLAGATLEAEGSVELGSIEVDWASAGKVKGFTLKPTGSIALVNVPKIRGGSVLPLEFENVSGIANLEKWSLRVNGADKTGNSARVLVRNGTPLLVVSGMMMMVF